MKSLSLNYSKFRNERFAQKYQESRILGELPDYYIGWANTGQTEDNLVYDIGYPVVCYSKLSRYRLVHGASFTLLGSLFMCGKRAARKAFWDVAMYQLMCDPLGREIHFSKYSLWSNGHA